MIRDKLGLVNFYQGLLRWCSGKESACNAGDAGAHRFDPWVGKMPWSRKWKLTPVFLLENSIYRGAWKISAHGVTKSQTWLVINHARAHTHTHTKLTEESFNLENWNKIFLWLNAHNIVFTIPLIFKLHFSNFKYIHSTVATVTTVHLCNFSRCMSGVGGKQWQIL